MGCNNSLAQGLRPEVRSWKLRTLEGSGQKVGSRKPGCLRALRETLVESKLLYAESRTRGGPARARAPAPRSGLLGHLGGLRRYGSPLAVLLYEHIGPDIFSAGIFAVF